MAGMVSVGPNARWSVASWLFEWVLKAIASEVEDAALVASIMEIVDENFGWFGVGELTSTQRVEVNRVVLDLLMAKAERDLPKTMVEREKVLENIAELVAMFRAEGSIRPT